MPTIGFPNGSLFEATIELFNQVGVVIKVKGRNVEADVTGTAIFNQALLMRPQDIPDAVLDGMIDYGVCGWDCVVESNNQDQVKKIVELPYAKKSKKSARVVVFGKSSELIDSEDILVTAEYPRLAGEVFKRAKIRFSHGSTEVKVKSGKYDFGVGITETGTTIEDNGLYIIKTLLISPTVLIAKEESPEIKFFGELLLGGLRANDYQLVKMNVEAGIKDKILAILPALGTPTISSRFGGSFAIETVVSKNEIADLIIKLRVFGATGILAQDINIIM